MIKYFFGALIVFLVSGFWLYTAMASGFETNNWNAVEAEVGISGADHNLRGRATAVHTPVIYEVDGETYEGVVDDFLVGGSGTVYVDPNDPTRVVGFQGPNLQHYGRPMIVTIVSGLLLVVLGLIAFSPKED